MFVKLLTSRATVRGVDHPGEIIQVDAKEGKALVDSQQAEPAKNPSSARSAKENKT